MKNSDRMSYKVWYLKQGTFQISNIHSFEVSAFSIFSFIDKLPNMWQPDYKLFVD